MMQIYIAPLPSFFFLLLPDSSFLLILLLTSTEFCSSCPTKYTSSLMACCSCVATRAPPLTTCLPAPSTQFSQLPRAQSVNKGSRRCISGEEDVMVEGEEVMEEHTEGRARGSSASPPLA